MAAPSEKLVESMLAEFRALTSKPEGYLGVQPKAADKFKKATKKVYDYLKNSETETNEALPELIINNFDEEQIWQEIELQNESAIKSLLASVSQVRSSKNVGFRLAHKASPSIKTLKSTAKSDEKQSGIKSKLDIDEDDMDFDENSEAENDADENESDNTDTEIDRIKTRLSAGLSSDAEFSDGNSDDLDFDFGGDDKIEDSGDNDNDEQETSHERIILEDDNKSSTRKSPKNVKNEKTSIVDDKFFKLSEMEVFLEKEDRREAKLIQKESENRDEDESDLSEDEDVDIFRDLPSDEDEEEDKPSRNMKYGDFFANPDGESALPSKAQDSNDETDEFHEDEHSADDSGDNHPTKKKVRFASTKGDAEQNSDSDGNPTRPDLLVESESEGEDMADIFGGKKTEEKSNFEKRQERIKAKISHLEEVSIADKPWQLSGEVSSITRPENSLLEEYLQFDQTTKLPPVITEETTQTIEGLVRQRIKDQAWDDVERKVKPKEDPFEYKKRIVLDQEKSKLSLGEIYEQEYLKQQQKEVVEIKDPDHEDIKKEMRDLFVKLDALCNFHFTPKPAAPDIKIVSNLPSISVEEVAPVSVSDATLLAPQEIQDKEKGESKGKTEKSETDRNRERREKKQAKRVRQKAREQRQKLITKLHPGLGNKYSKEKAMKELEKSSKQDTSVRIIKDDKKTKKSSVSSKTFFTQLQDEVVSQISKRKLDKTKNSKLFEKSSKKLKL